MNPLPPTADDLTRLSRGDAEARTALVRAWGPVVLRWCRRLAGPGVDPEDVAHDAFLRVFARVGSVQDPVAFPAWVFAVTRREILRHRGLAWVRRVLLGAVPERADAGDPDRDLDRARLARRVRDLLERLPTAQREVLVLCDLEERTEAEAAAILGIPVGTVKSRLAAGRRRFEQEALRTRLPVALAPDRGGRP